MPRERWWRGDGDADSSHGVRVSDGDGGWGIGRRIESEDKVILGSRKIIIQEISKSG